ncbi:hypothetical protein [Allokutzneria albata]|uniref:PQQ-like domain-containing protein n=1 Tax=Allokutzneria albata TaxID=211114 RepID=A0A1G9ZL77_ALLAB|nr:hypothetical protein [Allokutzneria albata]SDN22079.1 hypothetical protein SAMN04489726_5577 [Allokutzneria albata]
MRGRALLLTCLLALSITGCQDEPPAAAPASRLTTPTPVPPVIPAFADGPHVLGGTMPEDDYRVSAIGKLFAVAETDANGTHVRFLHGSSGEPATRSTVTQSKVEVSFKHQELTAGRRALVATWKDAPATGAQEAQGTAVFDEQGKLVWRSTHDEQFWNGTAVRVAQEDGHGPKSFEVRTLSGNRQWEFTAPPERFGPDPVESLLRLRTIARDVVIMQAYDNSAIQARSTSGQLLWERKPNPGRRAISALGVADNAVVVNNGQFLSWPNASSTRASDVVLLDLRTGAQLLASGGTDADEMDYDPLTGTLILAGTKQAGGKAPFRAIAWGRTNRSPGSFPWRWPPDDGSSPSGFVGAFVYVGSELRRTADGSPANAGTNELLLIAATDDGFGWVVRGDGSSVRRRVGTEFWLFRVR